MRTLQNEKILITGPAGQIAFPMATKLAQDNEVWGIARFGDPSTRDKVEAVGITTRVVDLANPDFSELPDDFTYVLHLAISQQGGYDFDEALRVNAEGTGLLMSHCRKARGFFIMSTCSIYAWPEDPYHPGKGDGPTGRRGTTTFPHVPSLEDGTGGGGEIRGAPIESAHHHCTDERVLRAQRGAACIPVPLDVPRGSRSRFNQIVLRCALLSTRMISPA